MPALISLPGPSWAMLGRKAISATALMAALMPTSWAATTAPDAVTPNADGEVIPADEPAAITAVTDAIKATVQTGFDKTGHAYRDAHRKAHGCVQAKFTVLDHLPANVAQGRESTGREWPEAARR